LDDKDEKLLKEEFVCVGVIRNLPSVWMHRDVEQDWNFSLLNIFTYLFNSYNELPPYQRDIIEALS
jgi:hypothetical protein